MTQPGDRLRRLASRVCDEASMTRVIDPILADLQWEDAEVSTRSPWRRRLVRARARLAFWRALTLHLCTRASGPDPRLAKPWGVVALVLAVVTAILAITAALIAPAVSDFRDALSFATAMQWTRLVTYLIPQALALAIPGGLLIGATTALVGKARSRRIWTATVLVASGCSLAAAATVWAIPEANQAFRELTYQLVLARTGQYVEPPSRGIPELSWRELSERLNTLRAMQDLDLPFRRGELYNVWFQYHLRVTLPVTPLFLAPLAIALSLRSRRRLTGGAWALLAATSWYFVLYGGRSLAAGEVLSPAVAAWAPNLAAALTATILFAKPLSTLRAKLPKHPAA